MKSYFHKHSNMKIRPKKCGKKSISQSAVKAADWYGGLIMLNALGDKNILGHRLVDGWTRWFACAYSGDANRQPKNRKAKRAGVQWIS